LGAYRVRKVRYFAAIRRILPTVSPLNAINTTHSLKLAVRKSRVRSPSAPPIESRVYGRSALFHTPHFLQRLPIVCRFRVQDRSCYSPRSRNPVRINPQCYRRIRMPELRRHVCQVRAVRKHVACPAVPEIVRRAPADFCKILNLVPHPLQEVCVVYSYLSGIYYRLCMELGNGYAEWQSYMRERYFYKVYWSIGKKAGIISVQN
jgi:hypothetical protein